ncbi:hypothetical protein PIB30_009594 [Stylosanthes scabra]|uniref:Amino acid transporter transmembrane domain-containing protein n=1 Tax=Stylosanthes scabra TaxID=79078 RepID=A0ABU6R593_9FABA|nr:hypothetical protein [Stylosanthes scabra]
MYLELYLVSIGFLILEGDNLNELFPNVELKLVPGLTISGKEFFVILVALIILPTVWLDDMSMLSYVSASGVFASAIIIISISWTATLGEVGFHHKGTLLNLSGIPTSVLLVCFILTTAGYAAMAIIGYLMFGPNVESQVTLNLPIDKLSSRVAIYTTLVNPISKYALMTTPITNGLKNLLPRRYKNRFTKTLVSTLMVVSTVIIAITVPLFGELMSLVGAFLSVTASILLPCSCYLKISGKYRILGCETIAIVAIIVAAVVIGIAGTYTSIMDIVHHL